MAGRKEKATITTAIKENAEIRAIEMSDYLWWNECELKMKVQTKAGRGSDW
jgi:hypothetical protein